MIVMKSGQALVAVLMALSILVTVGLSVASRSVTEVGITTSQEESAKALEAAEAGLEKAVGGTMTGGQGSLSGSGAVYVVTPAPTPPPGGFKEYIVPFTPMEGETASVDMKGYTKPTTYKRRIRFCWGVNSSNPPVALEVVLYYYHGPNRLSLGRRIYNPGNAVSGLNSSVVDSFDHQLSKCPVNFKYTYEEDYSEFMRLPYPANADDDKLSYFRIRLYGVQYGKPESVAVAAGNGARFSTQYTEFVSVGSAGSATQKIRGVNMNYDVPSIFDAAVFSGTSLEK